MKVYLHESPRWQRFTGYFIVAVAILLIVLEGSGWLLFGTFDQSTMDAALGASLVGLLILWVTAPSVTIRNRFHRWHG